MAELSICSLAVVGLDIVSFDQGFDEQPLTNTHERLAEFVHAMARTVSPEWVSRLDIDEIGGVRVEEQYAQVAVLAELVV
jgi:hypothetical protein